MTIDWDTFWSGVLGFILTGMVLLLLAGLFASGYETGRDDGRAEQCPTIGVEK